MNIKKNIETLRRLMEQTQVDWAYVSAHDIFLNEYVPTSDRLRYYFSNFTGSAGEMLVGKSGKAILVTDGRYTEQATREVDPDLINVQIISVSDPIETWMLKFLEEQKAKRIGLFFKRTKVSFARELEKRFGIHDLNENLILEDIGYHHVEKDGDFYCLDKSLAGLEVQDKRQSVFSEYGVVFLSNLESVSWMTNLRGYQFPFQSAIRGKVIVLEDKVLFFSNHKTLKGLEKLKIDSSITLYEESKIEEVLKSLSLNEIKLDKTMVSFSDYQLLSEVIGQESISDVDFVSHFNAKKNKTEVEVFSDSFDRSDKAIYQSFKWLKEHAYKQKVSEFEFKEYLESEYQKQGAISQSFNTISGFGPNGSIVHYGACSKEKFLEAGELALLDSGAYYQGGLATDCTRTMIGFGEADENSKKWYTLVLKSLLNLLNCEFRSGTLGEELDEIARKPLLEHGLDYGHGTGHGVGVNVHEKGYSIRPKSQVPLTEGLVGSVEPGFYAPGVGGIRLENIVLVERHPERSDWLRFKNFVYIGFDHSLIEPGFLSQQEQQWLTEYENECSKRQRSFL